MNYADGVLTLHQSDIGHYITCPEQFRVSNGISSLVTITDDKWRVESDAALLGSALHATIEHELNGKWFPNLGAAQKWAAQWFGQQIQQFLKDGTEYRSETYGGDAMKTLRALDMLVESWWLSKERDYWQHREPGTYLVEQHFDVHFVTRPSNKIIREIRLAGTPDVVDLENNRVLDWKSAGREYKRWEKQRWAVQPTAYTFAAAEQGLIKPNGDGLYRFDYRIFPRGTKPSKAQELTVYRGPGQWGWLTKLVNNIADMMESDAEHWPLRDDHALCGPKWCPIWYSCKGEFVDEDWN